MTTVNSKTIAKIGALLMLGSISNMANAADVCNGSVCANWKGEPNGVVSQWYGPQKHEIVDESSWHTANGSAVLSSGRSECYKETTTVGFDWNIPMFGDTIQKYMPCLRPGLSKTLEVIHHRNTTYRNHHFPVSPTWEAIGIWLNRGVFNITHRPVCIQFFCNY